MDPDPIGNDTAAGVWVIIAAYAVFIGIVVLLSYLLTAITLMFFFRKVGVPRWIAWIPVYNTWTWLRVGGQPGAIALLALTPATIVVRVFLALGMYRIDLSFRKDAAYLVLGIFLPWLWCILLAQPSEKYEPELLAQYGYPPPLTGYGAVARQQP